MAIARNERLPRASRVIALAALLVTSGACSPHGGGPDGTGGTFECGTVRCVAGRQYCFNESWNGVEKIAPYCRPLPSGCSTCACAKIDAAPASMQCKAPVGLTCTDGMMLLDDQTSSPTLSIACMLA
jgi:hypothetical protein